MSAAPSGSGFAECALFAAIGQPGSGAVRYAAAMHFYNQNRISAEMLEIYRRCCKFDEEDPIDLARFEGLTDIPTPGSAA